MSESPQVRTLLMMARTVSRVNSEIIAEGKHTNGKILTNEERQHLIEQNEMYARILAEHPEEAARQEAASPYIPPPPPAQGELF